MAKDNKVSANPLQIEWPRDTYHFTQRLKSELVRAAQRVNGDDEKSRVYEETLKTAILHNRARQAKMKEMREAALQKAEDLREREAKLEKKRTLAEVARQEQQLADLKERAGLNDEGDKEDA